MMEKILKRDITEVLNKCNDLELLDLVFRMLAASIRSGGNCNREEVGK